MNLHDSDSVAQNGDGPGVSSTEAANSTGAGSTRKEQSADAHFACPSTPIKGDASACYEQFVADRQRMLRSWRVLQTEMPIAELHEEMHATVNVMRQLIQLGACHEPEA